MNVYRAMEKYRARATGRVMRVGLNYLSDLVVRPGIEKRFNPLLLYRGQMNRGHAHRLWNMALLMMAAEAETLADGMKVTNNPAFSQLCGPVRMPGKMTIYNFFGRLHDNPEVTRNIPSFTEYVKSLELGPCGLFPVDVETDRPNPVSWRVSTHPEPVQDFPKERGAKQLFYPYVVHDGAKPDGHELVALVNDAVPTYWPDHVRADACQDLIVSILAGEISKDRVREHAEEYVRRVYRMHPTKYGPASLDAPLSDEEGSGTLLDVISDGSYRHWADETEDGRETD